MKIKGMLMVLGMTNPRLEIMQMVRLPIQMLVCIRKYDLTDQFRSQQIQKLLYSFQNFNWTSRCLMQYEEGCESPLLMVKENFSRH